MTRRSEDDLRAAFAQKAGEAPWADEVLRAVRRRELQRRPGRRRWLSPAIAAAAVVAVGVPIGFVIANGDTGSSNRKADNQALPPVSASTGSAAGSAATPSAAGTAVPSAPGALASAALCRPGDVSVTIRPDIGKRATVVVTARSGACTLARVPKVRWTEGATRLDATPPSPATKSTALGRLAAGATATAELTWTGSCIDVAGGTVTVDWGSGPVQAQQTTGTPCLPDQLRVGAFTGLS